MWPPCSHWKLSKWWVRKKGISPLTQLTDQVQLLQHQLERQKFLIFEGFLRDTNWSQKPSDCKLNQTIINVVSFPVRVRCHIPAECRHTAPETPPGGAPLCWGHSGHFLLVPMMRGRPAAVHCTSCLRSLFSLQRKIFMSCTCMVKFIKLVSHTCLLLNILKLWHTGWVNLTLINSFAGSLRWFHSATEGLMFFFLFIIFAHTCTFTLALPMALRACDCSCRVMWETESATTRDRLWNMCSTACRQTHTES